MSLKMILGKRFSIFRATIKAALGAGVLIDGLLVLIPCFSTSNEGLTLGCCGFFQDVGPAGSVQFPTSPLHPLHTVSSSRILIWRLGS